MSALRAFLGRYSEQIFAVTRIVIALNFASHGAQKLFGVLGGERATAPLFIVAGVIEFGGGLLMALGWQTTLAGFIASGEMAVAYFMVHFPQGFWPIQNKGELAIAYCFFFLYVASRGAGMWSIEGARKAP
jgi:putative oxidoreductase